MNQEETNKGLHVSRDSLARLAISENGFVFDPVTGNSFMCNETALFILRQLQQQADWKALSSAIQKNYQVSERELERDLLEFTGQLREYLGE